MFLFSCDNTPSIRIVPIETAIQSEINRYKDMCGGMFRTPVHKKSFSDSVKEITGYSYYFELNKNLQTVKMHLILNILNSKNPVYRLGILFNIGFSLEALPVLMVSLF